MNKILSVSSKYNKKIACGAQTVQKTSEFLRKKLEKTAGFKKKPPDFEDFKKTAEKKPPDFKTIFFYVL